jgi:2-keto-4-pentenoate hydratase/2-oxohepta-3-ene-1,7-dioic acid hydratase in catechol pathway
VIRPGKIVCVGRNYAAHAKELGNEVPDEPKLFMKPPSSVIGPGDAIVRPTHMSDLVHHEAELAVVIGAPLSHAGEDEAMAAVEGYTCANDVTARDLQRKDKAFTRGKGFDTFCPLGPVVIPASELDPGDLEVRCDVIRGGETLERQRGFTRDMVFPVPFLLSFISKIMRLEPGDLILTGTPEGVGDLLAGDEVRVEIPGIGVLSNPVVDR